MNVCTHITAKNPRLSKGDFGNPLERQMSLASHGSEYNAAS